MVEKVTQLKIRAPKPDVFDILKDLAPSLFGDKEWTDVESFSEMLDDPSKLEIIFKEE